MNDSPLPDLSEAQRRALETCSDDKWHGYGDNAIGMYGLHYKGLVKIATGYFHITVAGRAALGTKGVERGSPGSSPACTSAASRSLEGCSQRTGSSLGPGRSATN